MKLKRNYEPLFAAAVKLFWGVRTDQATAQLERGVRDAGTRGAVTGGKHFDDMALLVRAVFADAGMHAPPGGRVLPGYYRANKNWDVVVTYKGALVAVIEFKSQVGSFGKNQNNRIEEMLGQSVDIWRAAREEMLGTIRPWFGYLMLMEDHEDSRKPRRAATNSGFDPDPVFHQTNYLDRYRIAFERFRLERDMDAVCLVASRQSTASIEYPDPTMTFTAFAAAIYGRVTEVLGMLGDDAPRRRST
jgi:type II restriction enzyme